MSNATLGGGGISEVQGGTGITVTGGDTVNLDVPVDETNGGTGQTTYATGDVLYASASNTLSKLTAGSDGEVLTLASGIPSWAASSGGGAWTYLASATASGSSQIEFTSIIDSTYQHYVLVIRDVVYSVNSSQAIIRLSSDNGSSYISSGYINVGNPSTLQISVFPGMDNTAGSNACAEIHFFNLNDSTSFSTIFGTGAFRNSAPSLIRSEVTAMYTSTTAIDAFNFFPGAGTITTGEFILYGVSES